MAQAPRCGDYPLGNLAADGRRGGAVVVQLAIWFAVRLD
jgi:hypothetical protein